MKAITGATLIDGTGSAPVSDAVVLIEGSDIIGVGSAESMQVPDGAELIEAPGMTVMPGLIDTHDHLASFAYEIASRWGITEPRSTRHLRIASVLRQTLETGYTTVRDAGGLAAGFRMAVDEGLVPGPRLHVALGFITPTGGMADSVSPLGYRAPAGDDSGLPWGVADGPEAMRAKVREMVGAGADVIKTATTGGASSGAGLGPRDVLFERNELEALVDEAHKRGKRVMCHALGGEGLRMAIEVGVDSIEHGSYLDEDPELLPMMAEKGICFTPTFGVYTFHTTRGTPHGRERAAALREHHVRSLEMALERGVTVTAGTDEGGWEHGNNAHEISCLVEAGMTPMQAIVAATGDAADCMGLGGEIGRIEAGKRADVILVEGNPLDDVTMLERGAAVRFVMKDGVTFVDERAS
ncbi:MAG: amidohydrolase family protein [Dehalococcoidia bacterium]|nr:amidohydrolase family protein [Dehalococcoidia bacterium]